MELGAKRAAMPEQHFGGQRPRYGVYFVPARSSRLWQFGSGVLGYDADTGAGVDFLDALATSGIDWHALTGEPRRYGFHATLKPPFELAEGADEDALIAAAEKFAAERAPFSVPALEIARLGAFVALVPPHPVPELAALAADCVMAFDAYRAPLTDQDRRRRPTSMLTPRQQQNLERWGYPWVHDDFRFHMTLTGPLAPDVSERALDILRGLYAPVRAPLVVDSIAIVRQPSRAARFVVTKRLPFAR